MTNIPGTFLQVDMDQDIHMILEGTKAELIVQLDPTENTNGKIKKANWCNIYNWKGQYTGCGKQQYYSGGFVQQPDQMSFKLNDYDWCVVNTTVNGKQCTIIWHMDELKISHVDRNVVKYNPEDKKLPKTCNFSLPSGKTIIPMQMHKTRQICLCTRVQATD